MQTYFPKYSLLAILLVLISVNSISGQFRPNSIVPTEADQLRSVAGVSWIDPSRFAMDHSFSMSFMSGGGFGGGGSMSAYSNSMRYLLSDNIMINSNIHIMQPSMGNISQPGGSDPMLFYDSSLMWNVTPNINFQLAISNIPSYRYSPYLPNYYSPLFFGMGPRLSVRR